MSLAQRQQLLADYIDSPAIEQRVRRQPDAMASEYKVDAEFARWLAQLPQIRVRLFRRSRAHKERVRNGATATQLGNQD